MSPCPGKMEPRPDHGDDLRVCAAGAEQAAFTQPRSTSSPLSLTCCLLTHSASSGSPFASVRRPRKPSSSARATSAKQWRMSPARNSPVISGSSWSQRRAELARPARRSGTALPVETLIRAPAAPGASIAANVALDDVGDVNEVADLAAVLETRGARPTSSRAAKIAATPV